MAFTIINTTNNSDIQSDKVLGIELNFNSVGIFKPVYTSDIQAKSNLKNLLLTTPGERVSNIEFGSRLMNIIFEQSTDQSKENIELAITDAVSRWLPYINIEELDIVTAADDPTIENVINIQIVFSVSGTIEVQTLSIQISEQGIVNIG